MRMLSVTLLSLGLLVSGAASAAPIEKCDNCETFRKGISRQVVPAKDVVCIYLTQPSVDDVLLRIDLKDGTARPYTKKRAGKTDRICVGRHWVQQAAKMMVCNSSNHADYEQQHVDIVAGKATHSRVGEACLYGKTKCREMGYQTRH